MDQLVALFTHPMTTTVGKVIILLMIVISLCAVLVKLWKDKKCTDAIKRQWQRYQWYRKNVTTVILMGVDNEDVTMERKTNQDGLYFTEHPNFSSVEARVIANEVYKKDTTLWLGIDGTVRTEWEYNQYTNWKYENPELLE